jgi:hypothetical protein
MDEQFRLPVVRYRIGLDPVLGLLPGGGDWVAWVASGYVIWEGARLGAPPRILATMAGYSAIDLVVGYVPVFGDLFDATYKCNRRNVDLLKSHFGLDSDQDIPTRIPDNLPARATGRFWYYLIAAGLLTVLLATASLPVALLWWLLP